MINKERYVKNVVLTELSKLHLVKCYCLYVFHRFNQLDKLGFDENHTPYRKRRVEDIQSMENVRGRLHSKVMNLLKNMNFTEKDISEFLEKEIERLVNEKLEPLGEDECYCGCCRIKIKMNEFNNHSLNDTVHLYLDDELRKLVELGYAIKLSTIERRKS